MTERSLPRLALTFIPYLTSIIAGNLVTLGGLRLDPLTALLLAVILLALYSFFHSQQVWQVQGTQLERVMAGQRELQDGVNSSFSAMMVWLGQPVELLDDSVQPGEASTFFTKAALLLRGLRPGDEVTLQLIGDPPDHDGPQPAPTLAALLDEAEHQRIAYTLLLEDREPLLVPAWLRGHGERLLQLGRRRTQLHLVAAKPLLQANLLVIWRGDGAHQAILELPLGDGLSLGSDLGLVFRAPRHNEIIAKLRDVLRRTEIAGRRIENLPASEREAAILHLPRVAG